MRRLALGMLVVGCAGASACNEDGGAGPQRKPPATGGDASSGETTIGTTIDVTTVDPDGGETGGGPCSTSVDCPNATVCVAPDAPGPAVAVGEYVCDPACVIDGDPVRWCADDAACCDGASVCVNGLCVGGTSTGTGTGSSGE